MKRVVKAGRVGGGAAAFKLTRGIEDSSYQLELGFEWRHDSDWKICQRSFLALASEKYRKQPRE
jgi:hypothetical protein